MVTTWFVKAIECTKRWRDRIVREENGQDLIEYALLAGFISLVAVAAITSVGAAVNGVYANINAQVAGIPGGGGS
jgi:pilus assembly protein Flp/PilA